MLKKTFIPLLCIGLLLGYLLLKRAEFRQEKEGELALLALPTPSFLAQRPSSLKSRSRFSPQPSQPEPLQSFRPYAKKPDRNIVEFKVVNGLAIAYGDIIMGKPDESFQEDHGRFDAPTPKVWDQPVIPYLIHPSLPDPKRVEKALDYFRQNTQVQFIPYDNQKDAVVFEPGPENCYSYVGKVGGLQPIRLAPTCGSQEILHEVMHALGFIHEQSRPDRDDFVEVLWDNIDEKYQPQFGFVPDAFFEPERGSSFDYHSIMLYPPSIFAIDPHAPTMRSLGTDPIAPVQEGLSPEDLRRIKQVFRQ